MATLQAVPAVGGQPKSPTEANDTTIPRSSQWKGMNKPPSTTGITVINRRPRSRHINGDRRLRGKKFLTPFYASILQVAGVLLVLMLTYHCVRRYTHCLSTFSREAVGGIRQGSAPCGASSHIPRRLAIYAGELDAISTIGTENTANQQSALCRQDVGDTLAQLLLPNEERPGTTGETYEAAPAQDSSQDCCGRDSKVSGHLGKGILQAVLSLVWIAIMIYVFSADGTTASAHTGGSSEAASSNSTAATPQPGEGGGTVLLGLKILLALLALVNMINEALTVYLLHLESSTGEQSATSANSNDAFVDDDDDDDDHDDDDVEKFLAPKGRSARRIGAGFPSRVEGVHDGLEFADEGPKAPAPIPESPAEGSNPPDQSCA